MDWMHYSQAFLINLLPKHQDGDDGHCQISYFIKECFVFKQNTLKGMLSEDPFLVILSYLK